MRKSYDSSSAAAFTASVVTGSSGIYKLVLSNSTTAISAGRYVYDVELILADSTIEKVHYGIVTVNPEAISIMNELSEFLKVSQLKKQELLEERKRFSQVEIKEPIYQTLARLRPANKIK